MAIESGGLMPVLPCWANRPCHGQNIVICALLVNSSQTLQEAKQAYLGKGGSRGNQSKENSGLHGGLLMCLLD